MSRYLRLALVLLAIAGCLLAVRSAAAYGFSHVLVLYSLTTGNVDAAAKATEVAPRDAESHFAHAAVLGLSGKHNESIQELENAVALRPGDYGLWIELGLLRDQRGNAEGALQAFDAAVALAPSYSKPHWQRGNALLRSGQTEAAFKDLNIAANSDADLIAPVVDLAWGMSRGDIQLAEQLGEINTDKKRIALAKVLIRRGKANEALRQLKLVSNIPGPTKLELVDLLNMAGGFKEAFALWFDRDIATGTTFISDGGFEAPLSFGNTGLGWRLPKDLQGAAIYLNGKKPADGSQNLVVEYKGEPNLGTLLSQLVLVESQKRYQINFASRSENIVSGGPPVLIVDRASDRRRLAESAQLPSGTTDWKTFSFTFTTPPDTGAIIIDLQRQGCTTSPCPIFGFLSLDSFSIEQIK